MSGIPLSFGADLAFYFSQEAACPYLAGMRERKLFVRQTGRRHQDEELARVLMDAGFRRSHDILYRQACPACQACVPVRILLKDFRLSKNQKKLKKRNRDIIFSAHDVRTGKDVFDLFQRYVWARHGQSDMAQMSYDDFMCMMEMGSSCSWLMQAREEASGKLVACMLVDEVENAVSAVYSFYDPAQPERGLGTQLILRLAEKAQRRGLHYLYLGYWIEGCPKMDYKSRFKPIELFGPEGWRLVTPTS
jgi:arginine-tRNA-protein transferase